MIHLKGKFSMNVQACVKMGHKVLGIVRLGFNVLTGLEDASTVRQKDIITFSLRRGV